ncbi:MAG: TetR/AcrR family transcriptional regulator [Ignavibacteria bacterium]|nr:TetR/AcrR family transcriptional regulator [Ignavibacteria bacterium]
MKNRNERLRILVFSDEIFRRKGLYKTSMDEIAQMMQISKKTIYKHFPSKEMLIESASMHMFVESENRVREIIHARKSTMDKFVAILGEYSNDLCRVSDVWINDLQHHYPDVWKKIDEFRTDKVYKYAEKLLKQGRKENIIHKYPYELVMESFVGGLRAVVNPQFLLRNNFSMNRALEAVYNIFLNGILTDEGKKIYEKNKKVNLSKIC